MRILLLDNYDSFTWNLVHQLEPLVHEVQVARNDAISVEDASSFDGMVLSPGPGMPSEAGIMPELIKELAPELPMLGVCLGMQAMAEVCGARLINLPVVRHGRVGTCAPIAPADALFEGLSSRIPVGLYHSWAVDPDQLGTGMRSIATAADGTVMAMRHDQWPLVGVQFHPESVMTPDGPRIIRNWVESLHQ